MDDVSEVDPPSVAEFPYIYILSCRSASTRYADTASLCVKPLLDRQALSFARSAGDMLDDDDEAAVAAVSLGASPDTTSLILGMNVLNMSAR